MTDFSPDLDKLPVVSALHDLERMAKGTIAIAPEAPAVPVVDDPLLALEQRWREACKAFASGAFLRRRGKDDAAYLG